MTIFIMYLLQCLKVMIFFFLYKYYIYIDWIIVIKLGIHFKWRSALDFKYGKKYISKFTFTGKFIEFTSLTVCLKIKLECYRLFLQSTILDIFWDFMNNNSRYRIPLYFYFLLAYSCIGRIKPHNSHHNMWIYI